MSLPEALKVARAAGIQIGIDGDYLRLEARSEPPREVVDLLRQHKDDILRFLRPACGGWSAEDWLAFYDERAGVAEFDGGLTRVEAEVGAYADCVAEWLGRSPHCSRAEAVAGLAALGILR